MLHRNLSLCTILSTCNAYYDVDPSLPLTWQTNTDRSGGRYVDQQRAAGYFFTNSLVIPNYIMINNAMVNAAPRNLKIILARSPSFGVANHLNVSSFCP